MVARLPWCFALCWATASVRTRFTLGVLAFHLVSLATATLAALATGYPLPFTA